MGFSSLKSILLGLPMGGVEIVFLVITSFLASYLRNARVLLMIFNTAVSMVGMVLVYCLDSQAGRMTGLVFTVVFAMNIPISLSLVTSNVAGFTKRSIVSSMLFVGYCVGNIVGPQFFLASEAPVYKVRHPPPSVLSIANNSRRDSRLRSRDIRSAFSSLLCCISTTTSRTSGEISSTVLKPQLIPIRNSRMSYLTRPTVRSRVSVTCCNISIASIYIASIYLFSVSSMRALIYSKTVL
jgi:hypothetical protein